MLTIRMPDEALRIAIEDGETRVRSTSVIHAVTVDEAMNDALGVVMSSGPVRFYASAHQAIDIANALLQMAERIRSRAAELLDPVGMVES